jgi:hypothetical protein
LFDGRPHQVRWPRRLRDGRTQRSLSVRPAATSARKGKRSRQRSTNSATSFNGRSLEPTVVRRSADGVCE